MKIFPVLWALLFAGINPVAAADGKYLNIALLTLPPRYLADVPMDMRTRLLTQLSIETGKASRLDYANGWLHWSYDGPRERSPGATSMFWLKLLPVENSRTPLVFVHMAKPFADGNSEPAENQTFILGHKGGEWRDLTVETLPAGIDLTMHFRPRRSDLVIEAAGYQRFERQDGRGQAYRFGTREFDLIWEDGAFRAGPPLGEEFTRDSE